jgi:hypothetical protein
MIAIFQVEHFLQPKRFCNTFGVPLVVQNALTRPTSPNHLVVGRANQIARVAFAHQLGHSAARKDGDIVGVRLYGGENFSRMQLARSRALDEHAFSRGRPATFRRSAVLLRVDRSARTEPRAQQPPTNQKITHKISTFHTGPPKQAAASLLQ